MNNYSLNSDIMCNEFFTLFEKLLENKNKNQTYKPSLKGKYFIFKNKFLKIIRDDFYLHFKNKLIKFYKRNLKWN